MVELTLVPMIPVPVKSNEDEPVMVILKSEAVAVNWKLSAENTVAEVPGT